MVAYHAMCRLSNFYPRSPCGERPINGCTIRTIKHFYPRSPCGERQPRKTEVPGAIEISIHALLAESDVYMCPIICTIPLFLSTLSLRRATRLNPKNPALASIISIHALLAESDSQRENTLCTIIYFYPRSPCGERPRSSDSSMGRNEFLSTLSLRRATLFYVI